MQITKVEKQEKRDRYNVYADGKFLTALDAGVLAESNIREGEIVTKSELAQLLERDRFAKALTKAYSLLARRPHASAELGRNLRERKYPPELIEGVIEHLQRLGYLDDASFAREWIRQRGRSRGPRLLRAELRQRGVGTEATEAALGEQRDSDDPDDQADAIRTLAAKRLERLRNEPPEKAREKTIAFLQRRGYAFGEIRNALDALTSDRNSDRKPTART
ncbi:MAG: regulatory protein RecX [Patescibacteria group bacterium]|nr:regulatory protein RecX [Patescibacteria group bacterium]